MRRKTWVLAAVVVLAAAGVTGGVVVTFGAKQQALAAQQQPPANTGQVERRTLSARVSQAGILTYRARSDGSPYTVINQARGTYTRLPAAGQVISQGQVLYRVNDRPVVLLHGPTPAYRNLSAGASGPDVAELNADLVALGYARAAQLHRASASFGWATTAAVDKLQAAMGTEQTGTLALGQAVFEPVALRVTSVPAQLGGRAQPGQAVLAATSTVREVQVALDASQQTSVAVGNRVSITLPTNRTTPGVVSSVAKVATCSAGSGTTSGSARPGTDVCSSDGSGSGTPTIGVRIRFAHPGAAGVWDQAPVQVGITTARVRNALTVPVTALLARSGGGYAVEIAGTGAGTGAGTSTSGDAGTAAGAGNHLVPVSLGLFDDADGLVQVTGPGLAAGQEVVVPST